MIPLSKLGRRLTTKIQSYLLLNYIHKLHNIQSKKEKCNFQHKPTQSIQLCTRYKQQSLFSTQELCKFLQQLVLNRLYCAKREHKVLQSKSQTCTSRRAKQELFHDGAATHNTFNFVNSKYKPQRRRICGNQSALGSSIEQGKVIH
ncbi:hypothetical protein TTHERM_000198015 (macronuclear) [Tetrahymena thermophila SB210]|uniref:Uncharacterized protein n=1 Tax=Tetrahymena thermophila (strain SB210) TaxID=312017 RepID=W7XKK9_TETTS|nr:hypothetical protein TTHERM_000198015 [Tetrahymena thermophila SB210]EWS76626.1 hypothetical protein TTHERM_000198015 [Tetrahymena thermophila SB210]|eukprot:XP_012650794.1 hypothetical protein TTHERM_000198015 [Tetrahymena thermophila SB210]